MDAPPAPAHAALSRLFGPYWVQIVLGIVVGALSGSMDSPRPPGRSLLVFGTAAAFAALVDQIWLKRGPDPKRHHAAAMGVIALFLSGAFTIEITRWLRAIL